MKMRKKETDRLYCWFLIFLLCFRAEAPHCKHASCNKCPLYTNAEEDDKRAVKEAGMNAAKSVNGTGKKKQVNVDVESLLKDPPPQWGRKR